MMPALRAELRAIDGLEMRLQEPLAPHTTYKVGGPAAAFLEVATVAALGAIVAALEAAGMAYFVLGNGSNVLVADAGTRSAVLHLGGGFAGWTLERDQAGPGQHRVEAGAALSITRLLRVAKDEDLAGLECLGGVPGTVGGAVRMNAGTVLGELKSALEAAALVVPGTGLGWVPVADLGLSYRASRLPAGAVVTAARFRVRDGDPAMRSRLDEVLAYRKATQPLTLPSCGSVFANPPGDHAGRLIEACGLKGRRIGGAEVSTQHANWIVNRGGASAADVRALIRLCQAEVERQHGVVLRPEVQLLGDWEEGDRA
jgi:UDP-N-acetylmuramate dehydrogenase